MQRLVTASLLHRKNRPQTDTPANRLTVEHKYFLPEPDTISQVPDTVGLAKSLIEKATPIWAKRIRYKTFSGKAKVHFESADESKDFTAHIKIKKDSAIWVNITMLSLTAARVFITPDSFFMLIPLQREILKMPLSGVAKILPTQVDFKSLQNMIIGDPLRDGTITGVSVLATSWLINVQDSNYQQQINFNISDSTMQDARLNTFDPKGPRAVMKYDSYETYGEKRTSSSRKVNIMNGNDNFLLEMELQNIEFDQAVEMPFNIPKGYTVRSK